MEIKSAAFKKKGMFLTKVGVGDQSRQLLMKIVEFLTDKLYLII